MKKPILINSISNIVNEFETFILDQWGVMHDGKKVYKHAVDCINKLYSLGKNLIMISNSSKKKYSIIKNIKSLGYNYEYFTEILSSGQLIWEELKKPTLSWSKKLGKNCYHLPSNHSKLENSFLQGINRNIVNNIDSADFILGSSVKSKITTLDYVPILKNAINKKLPFVCANPDYESIEKDSNNIKKICMGTIAKLYEDFGGDVFMLGKPTKLIYQKSIINVNNFGVIVCKNIIFVFSYVFTANRLT